MKKDIINKLIRKGVVLPEKDIIRNKGIILFDSGDTCQNSTFPLARDHQDFMEKYIQDQIEKRYFGEKGFPFDFYILCAYPNSARNFKQIKISIWSTIWWFDQLEMNPLYHSWTHKSKKVNEMARVCIIGDWSRQNSYPIFLYDAIKELANGIGFIPTATRVLLESDLYKIPFGKAFNSTQLYERDKNEDLIGELNGF